MGIDEARELFEEMGIPFDDNGMISRDLSKEQIEKLKEWYKSTKVDGIQMPTEQSFYENVLLALSLFPQVENGNINYLFGKGIGIEVALRGNIGNREKNNIKFPYRSHSDFEMYGMDGEYDANFQEIFGSQEKYPTTKTKGLHEIEPGLMHEKTEIIDLDGITVLVPELEILFLDKYLKQESTPRDEGIDALLLAKQYNLDFGLIHKYLFKYNVKPEIKAGLEKKLLNKDKVTHEINKFLEECYESYFEDNECYPSIQELCDEINDKITSAMAISKNIKKNGISISAYSEFSPEDLIDIGDSKFGVSNKYVKSVIENLARVQGQSVCDTIKKHRELNDFCVANSLPAISGQEMQDVEKIVLEYLFRAIGKDAKEMAEKNIEDVITSYFVGESSRAVYKIEH